MQWKRPDIRSDKWGLATFVVLLAVLLGLAIAKRAANNIAVLLLVCLVLVHPERKTFLKGVVRNPYFIFCFLFVLIQSAGLLYTENFHEGWRKISKDALLVAVPFFFCAYKPLPAPVIRRLIGFFSLLLFFVSLLALMRAVVAFSQHHDTSVFFYHPLSLQINHHAVFFSFYLLFCIVYWLEEGIKPLAPAWKWTVIGLLVYFVVLIVLLSSKLVIGLMFIYLVFVALRKALVKGRRVLFPLAVLGLLTLISIIGFTNNPVKSRFVDMASGSITLFKQETFSPEVYLNGLQFRLLIWRFTYEILNEQRAWLHGVGTGDAQVELEKKYVAANLYQGENNENKGYLEFNSHNLFLQTTLESGLAGLAALLAIIVTFIVQAYRARQPVALIYFIMVLAFCFTESVLSSQYTILLFTFFPLLALHSRERPKNLSYTLS